MAILRVTGILVGTAAYWGLAVLGEGGVQPFLDEPALWALTAATLALAGAACFAGGNLSPGVREDRRHRWVIVALGLIGLLAGYLPAHTDRHNFLTIDGATLRWAGVGLHSAGGVLRLWPVFIRGNRFSVTGCARTWRIIPGLF